MRTLIVANKSWEADPLVSVLSSARVSPGNVTFQPRRDRKGLRGIVACDGIGIEVWCLQELMPDGTNASSTYDKAQVLKPLLGADDISLVIAFGTAATAGEISRNGSVVIGTKAFVHDPGANSTSHWKAPQPDVVLDSTLTAPQFNGLFSDPAYRPRTETAMIAPPVRAADLRTVLIAYNYVALSDINVTNYDDYAWADQEVVNAFHASGARDPIGSLETTHAVIRSCTAARFIFISGITDRVGYFQEDVDPRTYAQNFVAAHNAGVATSMLIPAIAAFAKSSASQSTQQFYHIENANNILAALAQAQNDLSARSDVLTVKAGYAIENGTITDRRVIVVVPRDGADRLPDEYGGFRVEVRGASIEDVISSMRDGGATAFLDDTIDVVQPYITYEPPTIPLNTVQAHMHVLADVSPDAGWPVLQNFLAGVKQKLIVAMYLFGAPHIEQAVASCFDRDEFDELLLTMQRNPPDKRTGTKADDTSNDETVNELEAAAGRKEFEHCWVKLGAVNGWVASAYHIKVAVADGKRFWLSSGNWASSNKPDADPLTQKPADYSFLTKYDRDCDIVIEHDGLAGTFESFIRYDYKNNESAQMDLAAFTPAASLLVPSTKPLAEGVRRFFEPFDQTREFTVTPLLTPDNYFDIVVGLLSKAKEEILIENQTISGVVQTSRGIKKYLQRFLDTLLDRKKNGVSIRLIFRDQESNTTADNFAALKDYGFEPDAEVRAQKQCHIKSLIVDRKIVVVGSHNISDQGISVNRDASLLFDDAELASYYAQVFEFDWSTLASGKVLGDLRRGARLTSSIEVAADGEYEPIPWAEVLEGLA